MARKKRWATEDSEETRTDFDWLYSRPIDKAVDKYFEEHPEEAEGEVVAPDLQEIEDLIPPLIKRDANAYAAKKLKHLGGSYDNREYDPNDAAV